MISYDNFKVGDQVKVNFKIKEQGKERVVLFEGVVIAIRGRDLSKTMTVRKVARGGIAVERIFPLTSPNLVSVSVKREGRARRAKLYYLRKKGALKEKS